mmetsp:Transcript_9727/g.29292  ORF Transcript_9727/g.29292 Transcript_9727/m.29292 type:complete len:372 (+) Transcript_9727:724-1839(+)|eukprot:CAMPEP_0206141312 /NCGR_PEP_ID=MMETSP1473-20131121/12503_1 /ASSEMBLY_ACC=CAM_ASM_001109 /TAXON_ID=1461547 /ORGANISM="Stichococcus sp, Strain RCC1054" /LENGTH=371 /DNA_ID=CAMNT_0053535827 /DNA_START=640 /DNA_END=1755 /DNA_ORIENTATION=+
MIQEVDESGQPLEVLLWDDPAWANLTPMDLSPGEGAPVVEIGIDPAAQARLAFLYAAVAAEELSDRVLGLTQQVIEDNPANYTAWGWRWRCLRAGWGVGKEAELDFLRDCTLGGAKNYQLWNHRRHVALELEPLDAAEELQFTAACLRVEPKNYHVWAHRQAVLLAAAAPEAWAAEAALIEQHLAPDVRNNSAWAQRAFLLRHWPAALGIDGSTTATDIHPGAATAGDASRPAPSQVRYEAAAAVGELEYVRRAVLRAPASSSAWGYLGALLQLPGGAAALVHDDRIPALCSEALELDSTCCPAMMLLADLHEARASAARASKDEGSVQSAAENATAVQAVLAAVDPIRRQLYNYSKPSETEDDMPEAVKT